MDIEFHYYITNIIARYAGFDGEDANIIAYASQYVDDNDICFTINSGQADEYKNFISQTMDILKPKNELLRIYPIFHFVPGDPEVETACRRDGLRHILNTTPDSRNANYLLKAAFKAPQDIKRYQIGVATHAFVDTWAHQNFIGWNNYFNGIDPLNPLPNIGHAEAGHKPDIPTLVWRDKRLNTKNSSINNIDRFLEAGHRLFDEYKIYLANKASDTEWNVVENKIEENIGNAQSEECLIGTILGIEREKRIKRYKTTLGDGIPDYEESSWFDDAIETNIRGLKDAQEGWTKDYFTLFRDKHFWKPNYQESHWFRFQEAVKNHERVALDLLAPTFAQMSIELQSA